MNPPALRASSKRCASLNRGAGLAAAQSAWPETKAIVTLAFGLRRHRIEAVIPRRKDPRASQRGRPLKFDREAYRQRNAVERCIGWLKENRRVAVRYEKLATNYLGMLKLAMIQRHLRNQFPNRT